MIRGEIKPRVDCRRDDTVTGGSGQKKPVSRISERDMAKKDKIKKYNQLLQQMILDRQAQSSQILIDNKHFTPIRQRHAKHCDGNSSNSKSPISSKATLVKKNNISISPKVSKTPVSQTKEANKTGQKHRTPISNLQRTPKLAPKTILEKKDYIRLNRKISKTPTKEVHVTRPSKSPIKIIDRQKESLRQLSSVQGSSKRESMKGQVERIDVSPNEHISSRSGARGNQTGLVRHQINFNKASTPSHASRSHKNSLPKSEHSFQSTNTIITKQRHKTVDPKNVEYLVYKLGGMLKRSNFMNLSYALQKLVVEYRNYKVKYNFSDEFRQFYLKKKLFENLKKGRQNSKKEYYQLTQTTTHPKLC